MTSISLIYVTFSNKHEAVDVAKVLLEERLIACANINDKVTSFYRWQGELEETHETVLIAKTTSLLVKAAVSKIESMHSFQTPCILAIPVERASAAFAEWVAQETAKKA